MTNKLTVKAAGVLLLLFIGVGALNARVVVAKAKQNAVLNIARDLLSSPAGSSELAEPLKDPFYLVKVQEEVVEEVVEKAPIVATARPLTDTEILELVSVKLRPSGFIDQGGQQYLVLNGKKVQDGVSFNFPHQERLYSIQISEIQTKSFTLNLNSESKTISME